MGCLDGMHINCSSPKERQLAKVHPVGSAPCGSPYKNGAEGEKFLAREERNKRVDFQGKKQKAISPREGIQNHTKKKKTLRSQPTKSKRDQPIAEGEGDTQKHDHHLLKKISTRLWR